MAEYLIQSETLDAIADAINAKTGGSSAMTPAQMVTAIGTITGGGGLTPQYHEYVQAEAWPNDTKGNATNFSDTYLNLGPGVYRAIIENNSGPYNGQTATLIRFDSTDDPYIGNTTSVAYSSFTRGSGTAALISPSTSLSFWIAAGSKIKVNYYPIAKGVFNYPS